MSIAKETGQGRLSDFLIRRGVQEADRPGEAFGAVSHLLQLSGHAACRLMDVNATFAGGLFLSASAGRATGWWDHYLACGLWADDPWFGPFHSSPPLEGGQFVSLHDQVAAGNMRGRLLLRDAVRFGLADLLLVKPDSTGKEDLWIWQGLSVPYGSLIAVEQRTIVDGLLDMAAAEVRLMSRPRARGGAGPSGLFPLLTL